jgi:hypothetical protein
MIDGIDINTIGITSMSMSQPGTSMASLTGEDDTINDVSMADP